MALAVMAYENGQSPPGSGQGPGRGLPPPIALCMGDDYVCDWPLFATTFTFSRVGEQRGAVRAELRVEVNVPGAPSPAEWTTIADLASSDIRSRIAERLYKQWSGPAAPPYQAMLLAACFWVHEEYSKGAEVREIGAASQPIRQDRYLLRPFLVENQINMLYADGASLKSMIALAVGMSIQERRVLLPGTELGQRTERSRSGRVLMEDHETSEDEQHARVRRLSLGFGFNLKEPILYRASHRALWRDSHALRQIVEDHDVSLVIVDSLGAALGGDPNDAASVIAAFEALRSLETTVLLVDHVTKLDDQMKPIGSTYKWDYARSAFYAKRVQEADSDAVQVALIHTKANNGRLVRPKGLTVKFSDDEDGPITISGFDVREEGEFQHFASAPDRFRYALGRGGLDSDHLREAVGDMKADTFNKTLKRLRAKGEIITIHGDQKYYLRTPRTEDA